MSHITFIEKSGARRAVDFDAGESILSVARRNNIDMEGACDGVMACSTCHVIVEKKWNERLPKMTEEENATLDLAVGVTRASRLGCQIKLTDELDGITVRVA
jgi:2Fe-2S ferredoxin